VFVVLVFVTTKPCAVCMDDDIKKFKCCGAPHSINEREGAEGGFLRDGVIKGGDITPLFTVV